jgi:hypothetical protein
MKHQWKMDNLGKPDEWAWEYEFHNGVYCERCGKTVCVHCDPDWELMDDCMEFPKPKPKTNADRIRAMSDEELRDFLQSKVWLCETHKLCDTCTMYDDERGCLSLKEWLKRPAEEE